MTRAELIRMFVLNSMCDDYEDIEQITKWAVEWGLRCRLTISHEDIIQALRDLIELGYAKAWDLTRWPDEATAEYQLPSQPDKITPLNPRFVRTDEGLAFHEASSDFAAFDEDLREKSSNREELIRFFILRSYGSCTHLSLKGIEILWNRLPERHGIDVSRDEFIRALRELMDLGLLKAAYRDEYWQYNGMPPLEDIKAFGAYFWLTNDGSDFHTANESWWPFDEDDDEELTLRKDWLPPVA